MIGTAGLVDSEVVIAHVFVSPIFCHHNVISLHFNEQPEVIAGKWLLVCGYTGSNV